MREVSTVPRRPPPLVGRGQGWGWRRTGAPCRFTPPLSPPHKGEGNCVGASRWRQPPTGSEQNERRPERRHPLRGADPGRHRHLQPAVRPQCADLRDVRSSGRDLRHAAPRSLGARAHRHRRGRARLRRRHRHLALPRLQERRGRPRLRGAYGGHVRQARALPGAHDCRHPRHLHRRRGRDRRRLRPAHRHPQLQVRLPHRPHARQLPLGRQHRPRRHDHGRSAAPSTC